MTTIITRLYNDKRKASRVVSALKSEDYLERDIDVVTGKDDPDDTDHSAIRGELRKAGVYPNAATIYAQKVAEGHALLVVRAPFGRSLRAIEITDSFQPIRTEVKHTEVFVGTRDKPRVYNDKYLPVLLDDTIMTGRTTPGLIGSGTPLSSLFGFPLLTDGKNRTRLLTKNPFPLSSLFGLTLLTKGGSRTSLWTNNPFPFSSLFGLPLLLKKRSEKSAG
ncbi:MAG: hypothetical protein JJ902_07180 [Roseibium sp.]|nr:hypothetical protein [Roseibium sp.]